MEFLESLKPFIELLIGSQGKAAQVAAVLLAVQSVNKILQVVIPAVKSIVAATPGKGDDEFVAKVEGSKAVAYVKWAVDFLFRIKLK
jgi:hypothetical protein